MEYNDWLGRKLLAFEAIKREFMKMNFPNMTIERRKKNRV